MVLLDDERPETLVAVWLTGDPSYVHEELASIVSRKLTKFRIDQGDHLEHSALNRMDDALIACLDWVGSPRVTITATRSGQVESRRFKRGDTLKEPDALFHAGEGIPKGFASNFCAVGVAFGHEDVAMQVWTYGHLI